MRRLYWKDLEGAWSDETTPPGHPMSGLILSPPTWMARLPTRIHAVAKPSATPISVFDQVAEELRTRSQRVLEAAAIPFVYWQTSRSFDGTVRLTVRGEETEREVAGQQIDYISCCPTAAVGQLIGAAHAAGFDVEDAQTVRDGAMCLPLLIALVPWRSIRGAAKLDQPYFCVVRTWLGDEPFHRDVVANRMSIEDRILLTLLYSEPVSERVREAAQYLDPRGYYRDVTADCLARARALGIEDLLQQAQRASDED